ncbi:MAG: hypothetical protein Q3976_05100 [Corynebacterium sp.]|nr:hypothetical protein [Corynebacterium sp.]
MATAEQSSDATQFVSTDVSCLLADAWVPEIKATLASTAHAQGFAVSKTVLEPMNFTCEPDNMLLNQYASIHGHVPPSLQLYRVVVQGETALPLAEVTKVVVAALPKETFWYGTTIIGDIDLNSDVACTLPHAK